MPNLGDLFGKESIVYQMFVWGVVQQVITSLAQPYFNELTQLVLDKTPDVPLSPPDLAQAVVRGFMPQDQAAKTARRSGIDTDPFGTMVQLAGDAPAPGDLATALRRGLIPAGPDAPDLVSFADGIREGRLADKWTSMMQGLSLQWPSPADIVDATVESQVTLTEGKDLYHKVGGDPQWFQLLVDTRGNPPSPSELATLANRQVIPWSGLGPSATTFEQGIHEGATKDKWEPLLRQLAIYLPPERTVSTLLSHGAITTQQAAAYWAKEGMDQATVEGFILDAAALATESTKGLTETAILDMYYAQFISEADTLKLLEALHMTTEHAQLMMAYTDMKRAISAVNTGVTRIQTLYIGHKITRDAAIADLNSLQVPAPAVQSIVQTWDLLVSANVKALTESQITDAWAYQVMTASEALTELQNIGYTPYDAWVVLSVKAKAPLPGKPSQGPGPAPGTVQPSVTG